LLSGFVVASSKDKQKEEEDAQILAVMDVFKEFTGDSHSYCIGDLLDWQRDEPNQSSIIDTLRSAFPDNPQAEYLELMLKSSTRSKSPKQPSDQTKIESKRPQPSNKKNLKVSPQDAIRQRIKQVREIIPGLGDGFIETALVCYNGDASRTIAALSGPTSSLHPRLQWLDRQLPARRHDSDSQYGGMDDDEDAKRLIKAELKEMDRRQEHEALVMTTVGEYNDDYDDQFDGDDGGVADSGMYDYDTIRERNRVVIAAEKEDSFWEENRNLNRTNQNKGKKKKDKNKKQDEGEEEEGQDEQEEEGAKKFRGPDKAKGGRIIGPDGKVLPRKKGGNKPKTQEEKKPEKPKNDAGSEDMSRNQKRYKNDNKAKIGNHHRKERAQKKANSAI